MELIEIQHDPLHHACIYGTFESVQRLVDMGTPIDCEGLSGLTPLGLLALKLYVYKSSDMDPLAVREYEEKIKFLIKKGANFLKRWLFGLSIAELIFLGGNKSMINLLLNRLGDLNRPLNACGDTPLLLAVRQGYFKITKKILERNVDVNSANCYNRNPLLTACAYKRAELIDLLIQHGGSLGWKNSCGETVLHRACYHADKKVIQKCLEHSAPIHAQDHRGFTPMHRVVSISEFKLTQAEEVVELFIDRGFELETTDSKGRTPLYLSFQRDSVPITRQLWRNGAHLEIKSDDADSLLRYVPQTELDEKGRTILQFLAVEVSKGTQMNRKLEDGLGKGNAASDYLDACYQEIKNLKSSKIDNTNMTFWSILKNNIKEIALCTHNPHILEGIRRFDVGSYPIYGPDIIYKFEKSKKRRKLTLRCQETLNKLSEFKLPSVFVDMVVDTLTIDEMKILRKC